jgi:hypothetical protein
MVGQIENTALFAAAMKYLEKFQITKEKHKCHD